MTLLPSIGTFYGCRCGHGYGTTTGKELRIGYGDNVYSVIRSRTVLTCPVCNKVKTWRPSHGNEADKKTKALCDMPELSQEQRD